MKVGMLVKTLKKLYSQHNNKLTAFNNENKKRNTFN